MSSIVKSSRSHEEFRRSISLAALEEHLNDDLVEGICRQCGHSWRDRKLPPGITVRSCVHRALNADHSIAATLAKL